MADQGWAEAPVAKRKRNNFYNLKRSEGFVFFLNKSVEKFLHHPLSVLLIMHLFTTADLVQQNKLHPEYSSGQTKR